MMTNEQLDALVEKWATTVEGRKRIREIVRRVDHRLKNRPPRKNLSSESTVLFRVIQHFACLREASSLSQTALAHELGVNPWTIHRWESRGKGPGVDECVRWAHALGTSLREVLEKVERND